MKALILVGGYGTRLRPLTLSVPKPLIDFCNKSIVEHQLEALVAAGVRHVILAVAYQPAAMEKAIEHFEKKFEIKLTVLVEKVPLGTAGPIALAKELLLEPDDSGTPCFFLCNGDVVCEFPLKELLAFHAAHGKEGTILVTEVTQPELYGVVVSEPNGKIQRFVEKPKTFVGNHINAGLYLLNNSVIERVELRPTSIETEIFPKMAAAEELYCMQLEGYWQDLGQPADFIRGMDKYLSSLRRKAKDDRLSDKDPPLSEGPNIRGNAIVAASARIGKGCLLGPNVTIGEDCTIGDGVRIVNSAIMTSVTVDSHSFIQNSILGWNSNIGKWARIDSLTVVGQDVVVKDECHISHSFILPHKTISSSLTAPPDGDPKIVM
eukprot:Polyplicarium_translucidae@DN3323_c0_g1_i4.p4